MAKTKKVRKKKLSEIPTEELVQDLAADPKPNLLGVGEDAGIESDVIAEKAADDLTSFPVEDDEMMDPSESSGIKKAKEPGDAGEGGQDLETLRQEIETNLPIAIKADSKWITEAKEAGSQRLAGP